MSCLTACHDSTAAVCDRSKGAGRSPRVTTGAVFADAAIQRSTFLVLQDERQRALMHNRDVVRDWGRATVDVGAATLGRRKEGLRPNVELLQQRGQRLMGQVRLPKPTLNLVLPMPVVLTALRSLSPDIDRPVLTHSCHAAG